MLKKLSFFLFLFDLYQFSIKVKSEAGCFAILEGGYNHDVLGENVAALAEGLSSWSEGGNRTRMDVKPGGF